MKTAVILSARHERDSQIPYPLLQFAQDECLLKRSLEILRSCGYTNIVVIVGYKRELFEPYQSEDVHIVFNPDYEFCASMGSLVMAAPYINEDFLIIEGDTFYEKKIVETLTNTSEPNCLIVTEETGSGDECYVETQHGFLKQITKDKHAVPCIEGELVGVAKISLSVFRRMISLYRESSNSYMNYEYVLMRSTTIVERPCIRFQNLIWGDVDTQEDLKRLQQTYRILQRKENPFNEENLRQYLSPIFTSEQCASAIITQIGGMSNKNFKVCVNNQEYVLRVPGNGSEGMVERKNEEFNAIAGAKLGITPDIKFFDAISGIKLADYITNAETLNSATIQRIENMKQVVYIYKNLHNSHIRLRNEFNIFQEIEKYDTLIAKSNTKMYAGADSIRSAIMTLEPYLNELGVDLRPCHNDAVAENFVKDANGKIYLIDWEYSGMNDPMADLAALFLENDFSHENQDYILNSYFNGHIDPSIHKKILCYQILWDYLWAQWTIIKEAHGDDFGTYGQDRFLRATRNLHILGII